MKKERLSSKMLDMLALLSKYGGITNGHLDFHLGTAKALEARGLASVDNANALVQRWSLTDAGRAKWAAMEREASEVQNEP